MKQYCQSWGSNICKGDRLKTYLETLPEVNFFNIIGAYRKSCKSCIVKADPLCITYFGLTFVYDYILVDFVEDMCKRIKYTKLCTELWENIKASNIVALQLAVYKYLKEGQKKEFVDSSDYQTKQKCLEIDATSSSSEFSSSKEMTEYILNHKVKPTHKSWHMSKRSTKYKLLLEYGHQPEKDCCIKYLLEYCIYSKSDADLLLSCGLTLSGSMLPDTDESYYKKTDLVGIFLKYGWNPTWDDIIKLIKYNQAVPNIDKFSEYMRKDHAIAKLKATCEQYNYYPYPDIYKPSTKHIIDLIEKNASMSDIKRAMKQTQPDQKTFEAACKQLRAPAIRLLIDTYKFKPDLELLNESLNGVVNKSSANSFKIIFDAYYQANK